MPQIVVARLPSCAASAGSATCAISSNFDCSITFRSKSASRFNFVRSARPHVRVTLRQAQTAFRRASQCLPPCLSITCRRYQASRSAMWTPIMAQAGMVGTVTMRGMIVLSAIRKLRMPLTRS